MTVQEALEIFKEITNLDVEEHNSIEEALVVILEQCKRSVE